MKTIHIQNIPGSSFSVEEDETLFQAAERQGISIPVSCENGLCGTCKGQLISGKIHYENSEIYGLTPEEQACGQILFCCAKAETDLVIDHPNIELPPEHYEGSFAISELSGHLGDDSLRGDGFGDDSCFCLRLCAVGDERSFYLYVFGLPDFPGFGREFTRSPFIFRGRKFAPHRHYRRYFGLRRNLGILGAIFCHSFGNFG